MNVMRCQLLGLITPMGKVPKDMSHPDLRAHIKRLDHHPRLGAPGERGEHSITSEIRLIDFQSGLIFTKNSVYKFK